jgi:hypothetical protein
LPRDVQEKLFETAVPLDPVVRNRLAIFLHDRHPKTAHWAFSPDHQFFPGLLAGPFLLFPIEQSRVLAWIRSPLFMRRFLAQMIYQI